MSIKKYWIIRKFRNFLIFDFFEKWVNTKIRKFFEKSVNAKFVNLKSFRKFSKKPKNRKNRKTEKTEKQKKRKTEKTKIPKILKSPKCSFVNDVRLGKSERVFDIRGRICWRREGGARPKSANPGSFQFLSFLDRRLPAQYRCGNTVRPM